MPVLLRNPITVISLIALIIVIILYALERRKRKKLELAGDKFLQEAREKSWESINQSIKKSDDILGQAEIEGIKIVAGSKFQASKIEEEYSKKLSAILDESRQSINVAQAQLLEFMHDLQNRSAQFEEASKKAGEQRINQLFDRVENQLSDFLIQTEQKSTTSIDLELRATRQLIDTYKNQQLKLIDENIVAMMEQTLSIVLAKKLSLTDQLELIYEALERAKVEKFIV